MGLRFKTELDVDVTPFSAFSIEGSKDREGSAHANSALSGYQQSLVIVCGLGDLFFLHVPWQLLDSWVQCHPSGVFPVLAKQSPSCEVSKPPL